MKKPRKFLPKDASKQELALVAAGKLRLPKFHLDVDEFLAIPTGNVSGNKSIEALLADRDEPYARSNASPFKNPKT